MVELFETAADCVVSGDVQTLRRLLDAHPELVTMRSERPHAAMLLHYAAANGVEDIRQTTPQNIVEIAKVLIDAGADVNAECNAYGGGATVLGLAATSIHPERAGVQEALLQMLIDCGAEIEKTAAGGNGQGIVAACLANGRGNAAKFLAARGATLTLATAAGIGSMDAVRGFFRSDGSLGACATKEHLQRGFVWACMYGEKAAAEFLLDHGADLNDQAGTGASGLHWAATGAHLELVRLLITRGAPLETLNRWGGTVLEQTGWAMAHDESGRNYRPVFEALIAAGAKGRYEEDL